MTAQTVNTLNNTEFTVTGPPGRVVVQYIDNFVDTMAIRTPAFNVRIPEYGAVGDGSSHPLSGITSWGGTNTTGFTAAQWRTLTGISAIVDLTDEMDWLAIEVAKAAATTAGGGVVYLPAGSYVCKQVISAFPSVSDRTGRSGISLAGDGAECTLLSFPTDHGSTPNSVFAITCAARTTDESPGWFRGFTLNGPNPSFTIGVVNCNLSGIGWGARRKVDDVTISGFYAGIAMVGDQTMLSRIQCVNCYYGAYWDEVNTGLFGDQQLDRWILGPCAMAAVGVSHIAAVLKIQWNKPLFGASPYGIYKETNGGAPDNSIMVDSCYFILPQFELMGNAAMSDDQPTGSHIAIVVGTTMIRPQIGPWYPTANIASADQSSFFSLGQTVDFHIQEIGVGALFVPGSTGLWNVNTCTNTIIEGDIDQLIGNCNNANLPFICPNAGNTGLFLRSIQWRGNIAFAFGTAAFAGAVLVGSPTAILSLSAGTATEFPAGVCMGQWQSTGSNNIVIATSGVVTVTTSSVVNVVMPVRTGAGGTVVEATGPNDTTSPVIGVNPAGGVGSGSQMQIFMRPWATLS